MNQNLAQLPDDALVRTAHASDRFGQEGLLLGRNLGFRYADVGAALFPASRLSNPPSPDFQSDLDAALRPTPSRCQLSSLPQDFRQVVESWADQPIRLRRVADQWRIDLDRTMRIDMELVSDNGSVLATDQQTVAVLLGLTRAVNQVAQEIAQGHWANVSAVQEALRSRCDLVLRRLNARVSRFHSRPADR